jgi:hypothetical protein
VLLMPPSLRDWVPGGHLVWTVLDAVAELDLSMVYADYRDDGRGRLSRTGFHGDRVSWLPLFIEREIFVSGRGA